LSETDNLAGRKQAAPDVPAANGNDFMQTHIGSAVSEVNRATARVGDRVAIIMRNQTQAL
jgi:hypothetical protein